MPVAVSILRRKPARPNPAMIKHFEADLFLAIQYFSLSLLNIIGVEGIAKLRVRKWIRFSSFQLAMMVNIEHFSKDKRFVEHS